MAGVACKLLAALDRDPVLRCPRSVVLRAEHARSAYGVSWLAARRRWRDGNARLVLQPVLCAHSGTAGIDQSLSQSQARPIASGLWRTVAITLEVLSLKFCLRVDYDGVHT